MIKIESRAHPDVLRNATIDGQLNRSWTFNDECRGRKSVCLDLGTERGRALALDLCARADVVAENQRGGVLRALGLDYDRVRARNPEVIYFSSQGYGRGGPLGEMQSFGPLNSAFAGIHFLWNHPDAPYPAGTSLAHPDHIAGKMGAIAVLAALDHRRRTGEGQLIDMAQTEAAAYLLGELYLEASTSGREPMPQGNRSDGVAPHDVYPCAGVDRWCAIAVSDDAAWVRLVEHLGWSVEPRLGTLEGRLAARDEIDARLSEWTRLRTPDQVADELQGIGVSAMSVQSGDDHRRSPPRRAGSVRDRGTPGDRIGAARRQPAPPLAHTAPDGGRGAPPRRRHRVGPDGGARPHSRGGPTARRVGRLSLVPFRIGAARGLTPPRGSR